MNGLLADLRQLGPTPAFLLMRRHQLTLEDTYAELVRLEAEDLVRVIATRCGGAYDKRWEVSDRGASAGSEASTC